MITKKENDQILTCLIKADNKEYDSITGETIIKLMQSIINSNKMLSEVTEVSIEKNWLGFPKKKKQRSNFFNPDLKEQDVYKAFGIDKTEVERAAENLAVLIMQMRNEQKMDENVNKLIDFINKNQEIKLYIFIKFLNSPFIFFNSKTISNAGIRLQRLRK